MFKFLVLLSVVGSIRAQDAYSLAAYIDTQAVTFFQQHELVKLEYKIVEQACSGATVEQIFENFQQTVTNSIGGATAVNLLGLVMKLQNHLGNEFPAVKSAAGSAAAAALHPALTDVIQYCGEGPESVLYRAALYAHYDFAKYLFDHLYWAIAGVSWNAWTVCRNDLAATVKFENFGY